jgi:hypothetical protein
LLGFPNFFFWWFFLPFNLPFYLFSPSYGLGLGVRGGTPWCLPFGSSLAPFVFMDPFRSIFGVPCMTCSTLVPDIYFCFSLSGVLSSPLEVVQPNTKN